MRANYRNEKGVAFDLSTAASKWVVAIPGDNLVTVQAKRFGLWSSGIIKIERSLDGVNPVPLDTPVTLGPPSGATVFSIATAPIDSGGFGFLHLYPGNTEANAACDLDVFTNRV